MSKQRLKAATKTDFRRGLKIKLGMTSNPDKPFTGTARVSFRNWYTTIKGLPKTFSVGRAELVEKSWRAFQREIK